MGHGPWPWRSLATLQQLPAYQQHHGEWPALTGLLLLRLRGSFRLPIPSWVDAWTGGAGAHRLVLYVVC